MNFDSVITAVQMHWNAQPMLVITVGVCVLFLAWVKPKFMFKTVVGIGCIVLCGLAFTSLTGTLDSGVQGRDTMLETAGK